MPKPHFIIGAQNDLYLSWPAGVRAFALINTRSWAQAWTKAN